jgi:hypothetical protein
MEDVLQRKHLGKINGTRGSVPELEESTPGGATAV